ncbi:MAG: hypothetical protein A3F82_08175 [Deltaproteobacteria bacterium RIFCSPLOWO2_12_FULL_44_12]|nr:MAG: hypothetical protein A2712_07095 [Deltaproteobacteria bacterium RIFCSPHIGHO2_01_FULL_43_49]OGQ15712.1 MAG: hypothetical protein A3D22_05885 [Deltaproteobacteria bacterium RIFCSPHIGHO2_02_FULL_44_53]OGQ28681.1 MAG: hypothetical protein A3D98_00620 [Deltaproteobacteria bacterium RIFCSPHIGHO2_12_FULL_44_21]OGQ32004.1 MAG: hypothetical protein A2979_02830 [Deltaproteobacteria bacterium RIFCSPLOWO2_01_FULL_45_74]OGQ43617.1 MAG: hypothetical protein A3I70_03345 [Deltaproteobacteria bacterium 
MFKKAVGIIALAGLMALGVSSLKAETSPNGKMRFGMVDFQKALYETNEGKRAEASLNAAMNEKKKKFDILRGELDAMKTDFEKQRLVLSGQPLEEKKQALQKKLIEVEQTGASYEQDLGNKKADALKKILTGLQGVVQDIGQKEGFTLIFEKSGGGVLFSSGAEDITDRVIKAYNASAK